jgi:ketosteroid isomerase-like protein
LFKPAIYDSAKLRRFFKDWFQHVSVKSFTKNSISIEPMNDHVLDLGTFRLTYQDVNSTEKIYAGNYLILWKRQGANDLKMVSHAFGSDTYLEAKDVPWAMVNVEKGQLNNTIEVDKQILDMVNEANAEVIRGVREGDGESRANGFTADAILMPNFEKYYVGMETIRPRMLKTYHPGVSFKVNHTFQRIYDLGDYVFVNGYYKGGWGDSNDGGWFEGNMLDVMKKMPDGKLKYYRQLANRDSDLIIFKK